MPLRPKGAFVFNRFINIIALPLHEQFINHGGIKYGCCTGKAD